MKPVILMALINGEYLLIVIFVAMALYSNESGGETGNGNGSNIWLFNT